MGSMTPPFNLFVPFPHTKIMNIHPSPDLHGPSFWPNFLESSSVFLRPPSSSVPPRLAPRLASDSSNALELAGDGSCSGFWCFSARAWAALRRCAS